MATFHIETKGCTHCLADAERMRGLLQQAKFQPADLEQAYIIILNTCAVKGYTENSIMQRIEELKRAYPFKPIILAGCVQHCEPAKFRKHSLISSGQYQRIVEVVEETLHNNIDHILEGESIPSLDSPRIRTHPHIELIPLAYGCSSDCSFCKDKRGKLHSYPKEEIIQVAQKAIEEGVAELWLTAHDTFAYGFDAGTSLPALLAQLLTLNGNFKIRVDSGSAASLHHIMPELYPLLNNEKMFQFIHLQLPGGNKKVLRELNQGINSLEVINLIDQLRIQVPHCTLAIDFITGYPLETEEDHWETQNLLRTIRADSITFSNFIPAPKTPLGKMKKVPEEVLAHRLKILTDIYANTARLQNESWMGWEGEVLIEEKATEPRQWIGRNFAYKPIVVEGEFKLGERVMGKVSKVGVFEIRAEVRNSSTY